jgi:D-amino peptidase
LKVYIWVDLEGISGLTKADQMYADDQSMDKRRLVTADVNAAIEGAIEAGATTVYINDTHPPERTILIEELNPVAQLIPNGVAQFTAAELDDSFAAMFALGLHAKPGTQKGFLDHCWDPKQIMDIRVNGVSMGEIGLTALAAGHFGVPMVLVTGDRAGCCEAEALLGRVETVITKEAVSRYQARCLAPAVTRAAIRAGARRSLQGLSDYRPFRMALPLQCEVDFVHWQCTEWAIKIPGAEIVGPRCVRFTARDGRELLGLQLLIVAVIRFGAINPLY